MIVSSVFNFNCHFNFNSFLCFFSIIIFLACKNEKEAYVCPPCDLPCDKLVFSKAGICPHCQMQLIKKSEAEKETELKVNEVVINTGSGVFLIEGGNGQAEKNIKIYYHKPENFTKHSKILLVMPGAGRNGDSYRDAWIEEAEKYSVLILSPMYSEEAYPFEGYHLGGLIKNTNLRAAVEYVEHTNIAKLNETIFTFEVNTDKADWIFKDFDRIFDLVKEETGSIQTNYDLFGHSAGGQILHRLAIFHPMTKANRIIAANAGFYTLPNFEKELPFGLKNTLINKADLQLSFKKKLILLVGELDNETETGGTLLQSTSANEQGAHRLARGKYFYEFSKAKANDLEVSYNWTMQIIPNVGHNHRQMGNAAAKLLYD